MEYDDFPFREVVQEDEQLDFSKMKSCPHCKKPIPEDATLCYYCSQTVHEYKKSLWLVWAVVLLVVIVAVFLIRVR